MCPNFLDENDVPFWLGFSILRYPSISSGFLHEIFQLGLKINMVRVGHIDLTVSLYCILNVSQRRMGLYRGLQGANLYETLYTLLLLYREHDCGTFRPVHAQRTTLFEWKWKSARILMKTCTCMYFCVRNAMEVSYLTGDARLCDRYRFPQVRVWLAQYKVNIEANCMKVCIPM